MKRQIMGLIVGVLLLNGCIAHEADVEEKIVVNQEKDNANLVNTEKKATNKGLAIKVESPEEKEVSEFIYYIKDDELYEFNLQSLVEKNIDKVSKNGGWCWQVVDEVLIYCNANAEIIQYDSKDKVVLESDASLIKVLTDKQSQKHYIDYIKNGEHFIKEMVQGSQSYKVGSEVEELVIYGGKRYYTSTNKAMREELGKYEYNTKIRYEDIVPMTYIYTSQLSGEDQKILINPVDYKESVAGKWEERLFSYLDMTLADVEEGRIYFSITIEDRNDSMIANGELGGAYIASLEGKNGEYKGKVLKSHSPFSEDDYSGFYSYQRYHGIGLNISKKNPDVVIEGIIFSQEGDWVYYSDVDKQTVAKTNLVTGEIKELFTAPMSNQAVTVVKIGDWIYYTEDVTQDLMNLTLYKWNELTQEKREQPIGENNVRMYSTIDYYENLRGERIYLNNGCIYKFNVETEEETVLKDQVGYQLNYMKVTE